MILGGQFGIKHDKLTTLTADDLENIATIQRQLGVTPRGTIKSDDVKQVRLFKEYIIFGERRPYRDLLFLVERMSLVRQTARHRTPSCTGDTNIYTARNTGNRWGAKLEKY